MKNRDYFNKPIQGNGRDHYGYGETKLRLETKPEKVSRYFALVVMAMVAALFIFNAARYFAG